MLDCPRCGRRRKAVDSFLGRLILICYRCGSFTVRKVEEVETQL